MRRLLCKSKIHRATVTGADLHYEGSLTVDEALMEAADLLPYEQVHVLNVMTGARLETYVIPGPRGSGEVRLNGPAARRGMTGDLVIVLTYAWYEEAEARRHRPRVVQVDEHNRPVRPPLRADV